MIATDEGLWYIGEGTYDTEYRKVSKRGLRTLFLYAVAKSTDEPVKVVVGLPLSQYKLDKDALRSTLISTKVNHVSINNVPRKVIIDDVAVYPEGFAAVIGSDFSGIVIDIGGRTTDIAEVEMGDRIKVGNSFSLPMGTLNLYHDFIKSLNSTGLDLRPEDAGRILQHGLTIDGEKQDVDKGIFKSYIDTLVSQLRVEYPIRTHNVLVIGGGGQLLFQAIKAKIPQAVLIPDSIFANAYGFEKVGRSLWS